MVSDLYSLVATYSLLLFGFSVCDRLDRIDALLDKICDKLNIQGDQLVEVLRLFSNTLPEK